MNGYHLCPMNTKQKQLFKILKNRYCLAEVATSGGKSLIISIVYFYTLSKLNPDAKLLLIVPSISLVTQMYDDFLKNFYGENNINGLLDYKYEIEFTNGNILNKFMGEIVQTNLGDILVENLKEILKEYSTEF